MLGRIISINNTFHIVPYSWLVCLYESNNLGINNWNKLSRHFIDKIVRYHKNATK